MGSKDSDPCTCTQEIAATDITAVFPGVEKSGGSLRKNLMGRPYFSPLSQQIIIFAGLLPLKKSRRVRPWGSIDPGCISQILK